MQPDRGTRAVVNLDAIVNNIKVAKRNLNVGTKLCAVVKANAYGHGAIPVAIACIEAGVDYSPIPNLRKAVFGEDRYFCIRAVCHGFEIWIDSHCYPVHLYKEQDYRNYMAGEVKPCFRK